MEENLEQPSTTSTNVSEQIDKESEGEQKVEGSTFGKFKDASSLLEAYTSLEKEFTRKAQKLSELKKAYENLSVEKTQNQPSIDEKTVQNAQSEENLSDEATAVADNNKPLYLKSDWPKRVRQFFEGHPDASEYRADIARKLMQDSSLSQNENCLEYAYLLAKEKRPANTSPKITDQDKEEIIREYLKGLKEGKSNLRFISGEATFSAATPNANRPKTIKEASNILEKLLQK